MRFKKHNNGRVCKVPVTMRLDQGSSPIRHLEFKCPDNGRCGLDKLPALSQGFVLVDSERIPKQNHEIGYAESIHWNFAGEINISPSSAVMKRLYLRKISTGKTDREITLNVLSRTFGRKVPARFVEPQFRYHYCGRSRSHNNIPVMKSGWANHIELTSSTQLAIY